MNERTEQEYKYLAMAFDKACPPGHPLRGVDIVDVYEVALRAFVRKGIDAYRRAEPL